GAISTDGTINSYLPAGRSFSLQTLASPTPTGPVGTIGTTTPTFQWSAVPGAHHYHLYVVDNTARVAAIDILSILATSYTPSAPLAAGHSYTWYIAATSTDEKVSNYLAAGANFQT